MLLCMLASPSPAQDRPTQRAPIIRVYPQDGGGIASSYITPAIEVSEDAYVFAVMMDLDGRIQVLYPELPGISVRVRARKELRLPNFFAGFNAPRQANPYYTPYGQVRYERYDSPTTDTHGTIIALASRAPFNFDAIEESGDWDLAAIRQLIDRRAPSEAARALAQFLGAKGEPIGRDYMRFSGQRQNGYYASNYGYDDLAYCGYSGYEYGSSALYRADLFARAAQMRSAGLRPFVIGYDGCGLPIVIFAPFSPRGGYPSGPPPRSPGDTTVFPKERFPHGIMHRPTDGYVAPRPAAEGIFPLSERPQLPVTHGATKPAPQQPGDEREIHYRLPTTTASPFPERPTTPPDHSAPAPADRAPLGVAPVYRPEPRVIMTAEPARTPAPVIERAPAPAPAPAPPPAVHESPVTPPSPPPARAEPQTRPEPAPVPPPRR